VSNPSYSYPNSTDLAPGRGNEKTNHLALTPDIRKEEQPEKTRILIIEDSDDHSELLLRQLRKSHLDRHVKIIADGAEAWDFLEHKCRVQELVAIFLDLHLPSLDGIVLLRQIREHPRLKDLSVVVISSSENPADRAECLRLRVSAFVSKPVSFSTFSKSVADVFHSNETRQLTRPE